MLALDNAFCYGPDVRLEFVNPRLEILDLCRASEVYIERSSEQCQVSNLPSLTDPNNRRLSIRFAMPIVFVLIFSSTSG